MHSRRWLVNYVLIGLIGAVAFLAYQADSGNEAAQIDPILGVEADEVSRLEVRTAETTVVLKRAQSGWSIEQPVQWPANATHIERLLRITEAQTESIFDADGRNLRSFGLVTPLAELIVNDTRIAFGANNPIGERRYAMIGSSVYLLPDVYLAFVTQGLDAIVDRRLLPPSLQLNSFRWAQRELVRDGAGGWQARGDDAIDRDWIERRIANWQTLEAMRIRPIDQSQPAQQVIRATLDNGETIEFQVIATSPEIVIAQPRLGLQYHFDEARYSQLLSLPDEVAG